MKPGIGLGSGQPARWILGFDRTARHWAPAVFCARSKYKHVSAAGYVPEADAWMFVDVCFDRTRLIVTRGADARRVMAELWGDADLIGIDAQPAGSSCYRLGFWCVPAIKHLIGLRSYAMLPDALWRDCVKAGGKVISEGSRHADQMQSPAVEGRTAEPVCLQP